MGRQGAPLTRIVAAVRQSREREHSEGAVGRQIAAIRAWLDAFEKAWRNKPRAPPHHHHHDAGFSARPLFLPGHERSVKASSRPLPGHSAATWSCWGGEPNGAAVLSLRRRRISHSCATIPIGGRCRRHCFLAFARLSMLALCVAVLASDALP